MEGELDGAFQEGFEEARREIEGVISSEQFNQIEREVDLGVKLERLLRLLFGKLPPADEARAHDEAMRFKEEVGLLQKRITELEAKQKAAEDDIRAATHRNRKLEEDRRGLIEEVTRLQKRVGSLRDDVARVQEERAIEQCHRNELERLENSIRVLQQKRDALRTRKAKLDQDVGAVSAAVDRLQKEAQGNEMEAGTKRRRFEELGRRLQEAHGEKGRVARLRDELAEVHGELHAAQAALEGDLDEAKWEKCRRLVKQVEKILHDERAVM